MENKILLIFGERGSDINILRNLRLKDVRQVFLCPIEYVAEAGVERLKCRLDEERRIRAEIVDFKEKFNSNAFKLKKDYIDFLYEYSERHVDGKASVKEYFIYQGRKFSVWWFSLLAEKNPYKSPSFTLFSKLFTILRLKEELGCDQIWIADDCGLVREVLNSSKADYIVSLSQNTLTLRFFTVSKIMTIEILRVFKFLVELAVKIIEAKSNTWKHSSHGKTLRNSELFAVTMFPFLDESKLEEGKFENMAYGSLQEALEENHKKKICWLGMYAPINGCGWHKAVRLAKKIKEKETFFLLEEYLGLRDIFGVIGTYVRIATRCLISNKVQKRLFFYRDPVTGLRVNLWEAFKKDYLSSFMGKVLISGIANYKAFSNFTQDLPEHAKVVYFAELHGWEKALNLACKEKKDVTCVGLQHTIVPLLLLTYFNHSQELKDQGYIKNTPLPDRLGCVGEITRDIFLQNHWPEKKLFISGGFRFRGFKNDNGAQKLKKQKRNQIIVAFSISPIENQEMFLLLLDAFKDKDPEFTVLFKSHPCESVEKMARDMHLAIDNRIFKFTDRPLDEIVPESKAMIVKQSSAAFWAIDNNIPVIIPHLYSLIDLCPLSGITDLGIYVKNANELFDACKKVILTSGDINADSYAGFLKRYLRFYSENKQYYESLATA